MRTASHGGFKGSDQLMTVVATAVRYRRVSMTLNAWGMQPPADEGRLPVLNNPSQ